MNKYLPHGWIATFYENPRRIMLTKPSRMQPIVLAWRPPFLTSINPVTNSPAFGQGAAVPDDVRDVLLKEARERWSE